MKSTKKPSGVHLNEPEAEPAKPGADPAGELPEPEAEAPKPKKARPKIRLFPYLKWR